MHFQGSMAYSMFPRTMSLDNKGSERVKLPTVIGYLNETSDEPLTDKEVSVMLLDLGEPSKGYYIRNCLLLELLFFATFFSILSFFLKRTSDWDSK